MKINCDVINDLLPLYVDDALSDSSRNLVEEHLQECEACRNTFENMRGEVKLPVNQETRMDATKSFKGVKKMVSKWKKLTVIIASLSAVAIIILAVMYLNTKTMVVPYDGSNMTIEKQSDGYYLQYHGKGDIMYSAAGDAETGEWTIEFSQTLWDKYIQPLFSNDNSMHWLFETGEITRLTTRDGIVIWKGSQEDIEAHEQWLIDNGDLIKQRG